MDVSINHASPEWHILYPGSKVTKVQRILILRWKPLPSNTQSWKLCNNKQLYTSCTTDNLQTRSANTILRQWRKKGPGDTCSAHEIPHTSENGLHTGIADIHLLQHDLDHTVKCLRQTNLVLAIHPCHLIQYTVWRHLILCNRLLQNIGGFDIPLEAGRALAIREPVGIPPPIFSILYDNIRSN